MGKNRSFDVDSLSGSTQPIAIACVCDGGCDGVNPSVRLMGQMELEVGAGEGERGGEGKGKREG